MRHSLPLAFSSPPSPPPDASRAATLAGRPVDRVSAVHADEARVAAAVSSGTPKQAAKNAIDGNTGTRWESAYSDPQWIYVDLGAVKTFTEVRSTGSTRPPRTTASTSRTTPSTWSAAIVSKTGLPAVDHRIDDLTGFSVTARYVRIYGTARATVYGYSIWELTVSTAARAATGAGGCGRGRGRWWQRSGQHAGAAGSSRAPRAAPDRRARAARCASAVLTTPSTPVVASPRRSRPPRTPSTGTRGRAGRARTRIRSGSTSTSAPSRPSPRCASTGSTPPRRTIASTSRTTPSTGARPSPRRPACRPSITASTT